MLVIERGIRDVNSVAYNHDSTKVISGSDDKTIKEWDLSTGTCLVTRKGIQVVSFQLRIIMIVQK